MPSFRARSLLRTTPEELYAWHLRPGAFERLSPSWAGVRLLERPAELTEGARARLELRAGPLGIAWTARHEGFVRDREFRDVQERGPMRRWVHAHRFSPDPGGGALLEDEIDYELPLGRLGALLAARAVDRRLGRLFAYRHAVTGADLERHAEVGAGARLRVAVSGASGLVGSTLCAFLEAGGHEVWRLVRREARREAREIRFDPGRAAVAAADLEGLDAVVHLAGENIAGGRWTAERKRRIRDSRVVGTAALARSLAGLDRRPRVLVSASAIGYYGDRGEERVDEASAPGGGFLAETSLEWERAAVEAERAGIRVVTPRIGVVLAAAGGALARLVPPFLAGAGGRVGSGRQGMSWIALDDLVGAIHFALLRDDLRGAVNAVAPAAVSNGEFARTLGRVLRRPAVVPLPAMAVRALFGEMGRELLLGGAYVEPARLRSAGFRFRHADLESALRYELGRSA